MMLGLIGNCQYGALVAPDGDVSWLCWPRFDASFVFGGLVGGERGGRFQARPASAGARGRQEYLWNTNVLRTRFEAPDGVFDVIDFAPRFFQHDRYYKPTMLIRILEPVEGQPLVRVGCEPRYDYGRTVLRPTLGSNHVTWLGAPEALRLTTDLSLTRIVEDRPFALTQRQYMALTWGRPLEAPLRTTCEDFFERTVSYWRRWVKHCHLPDVYQREIIRSALALKLHQFEDTGAIIAATTSSIPEAPGSSRNWDYRYCWIRDSYFTVQALQQLSHFEELEGYERFLRDVLRTSPGHIQPVYGISGETELTEIEEPELPGYRGHPPFRRGNDAYRQVQLDAYGQMLLSLCPLFTDLRFQPGDGRTTAGSLPEDLVRALEEVVDKPDAGLWEFRGIERIHTFTVLMHWAGARAARKMGLALGRPALCEAAARVEARARAHIDGACWDERLGSFVQAPGTDHLDASLLMLVNLGYLAPDDPRAHATIATLTEALGMPGGLLRRYAIDDGLGETTSCFTVCSFWLAEALARVGRGDEARAYFERVLSYANPLGLFSEDVDPTTGALWGNFPQTYSHVGLINAAFAIQGTIGM